MRHCDNAVVMLHTIQGLVVILGEAIQSTSELPITLFVYALHFQSTGTGAIIAGTWGGPEERLRAMSHWMLCHYFDMLSHNKLDTEQPGMLLYYLRMRPHVRTLCAKERGIDCDIKTESKGSPASDMMNYLWGSN